MRPNTSRRGLAGEPGLFRTQLTPFCDFGQASDIRKVLQVSSSKEHIVQFKGHRRGENGLYDTYEFAVTHRPDEEDRIKVNISLSVQVQLDIAGTAQLAPLAAKTVELHLLGEVPAEHYSESEEEGKIIGLTIFWYPGQPGQPETIDYFEKFEVTQG